jgi:acyl carrier protein
MTRAEFLRELEGVLELPAETLQGDEEMGELEGWDSLGLMSFIAMADSKLGVSPPAEQIAQAKTVGDLMALLGDRVSE